MTFAQSTYVEQNAAKPGGAEGGARPHNEKCKSMKTHVKSRGAPPAPPCGRAPTNCVNISKGYGSRLRAQSYGPCARAPALEAPSSRFAQEMVMSRYEIDFDAPPEVGLAMRVDGRPFRLEGVEPHVRRDGQATNLLVWSSRCCACDAPFTARTGLKSRTITKRCEEHRRQGDPATPDAARRMAVGLRRKVGGGHALVR